MNELPEAASASDPGPRPAADSDCVREFGLHPRVRELWFWQWLVVAVLISLPGIVGGLLSGWWLVSILAILVGTLVLRLSIRYHRLELQRFYCGLLPDGLRIRRGVWWQVETFVPRVRIQHTDVTQGPIARHFGMATLKVFTAGTQLAEIQVEGLPYVDALALRDLLLGRDGHDAL
jgi:membrane protein YdbS with pleckstrin-like domain